MNITNTFSLEPKLIDSVWYIEWAAVSANLSGTKDARVRARWSTFSKKHCEGKDGLGKYYRSKAHANWVIKAFKAAEKAREEKRRT